MRVRPMCWLDVIDLRAKKRDTCSVCSSWLEGTTWRTECRRHAAKRQWPLPPAHESLPYVLYFITEAPGMAAAAQPTSPSGAETFGPSAKYARNSAVAVSLLEPRPWAQRTSRCASVVLGAASVASSVEPESLRFSHLSTPIRHLLHAAPVAKRFFDDETNGAPHVAPGTRDGGERGEANQSVVGDRRSTTDEVAAPMPAAGLPPMA